jgi:hypothetical protein
MLMVLRLRLMMVMWLRLLMVLRLLMLSLMLLLNQHSCPMHCCTSQQHWNLHHYLQ